MRYPAGLISISLAALAVSDGASAQWRCDCTTVVGSCQATAVVRDRFIEVTSSVDQCARVDYFVDGRPFVALVVDGSERQDWIVPDDSPEVIVQSCQVCRDNAGATVARDVGAGLDSDGEPVRLIAVDPAYPPAALAAGLEGYVDVRFSLSPSGQVTAPEVIAAEPAGVFEDAALAALLRWRYTRPPAGEAPEIVARLSFDLDEAILSLADRPPVRREPAGTAARRNDCIREDSQFDFGVMVDVSLVNACGEPLLVYHCAAGTGPLEDRWVCANPEQTGGELAPAAGAPAGAAGNRRLELTRAPNTEYWWLACAVDDAGCREEGRQWIRSLNRQTASIDPQARTRVGLARSF